MLLGSIPDRWIASLLTKEAISIGDMPDNDPPKVPIGVRALPSINISLLMFSPLVWLLKRKIIDSLSLLLKVLMPYRDIILSYL